MRTITEIGAEVDEPGDLEVFIRLGRSDYGECGHSEENEQACDSVSFHSPEDHSTALKCEDKS